MGLLQLLTVGQSLSEMRDRPHRYKLRSGSLLVLARRDESPVRWPQMGGLDFDGLDVRLKQVVGEDMKTEATTGVTDGKVETPAFPRGRWSLWSGSARGEGDVAPARGSIQGELSLDNVKPLRNDLSDSDLELVAVTRKAPVTPVASVSVGAVLVPVVQSRSVWGRVRGWFKFGK